MEFLKSCNPEGLTDVAAVLGREFYELDKELQRREAEAQKAEATRVERAEAPKDVGRPRPLPPPPDSLADRPGGVPKRGIKRGLPTPPSAPEEEEYDWNIQWPQLLRDNMSLWNKQLYVRCPGCWRYFAAPSAFKQHLLHKKGTFRHVPDHIFQNWNCDALVGLVCIKSVVQISF